MLTFRSSFFSHQVEQFWSYYSYMVRPGDLPGNSNVHLFKHGIRPMWEVRSFQLLFFFSCIIFSLKMIEKKSPSTARKQRCRIMQNGCQKTLYSVKTSSDKISSHKIEPKTKETYY